MVRTHLKPFALERGRQGLRVRRVDHLAADPVSDLGLELGPARRPAPEGLSASADVSATLRTRRRLAGRRRRLGDVLLRRRRRQRRRQDRDRVRPPTTFGRNGLFRRCCCDNVDGDPTQRLIFASELDFHHSDVMAIDERSSNEPHLQQADPETGNVSQDFNERPRVQLEQEHNGTK